MSAISLFIFSCSLAVGLCLIVLLSVLLSLIGKYLNPRNLISLLSVGGVMGPTELSELDRVSSEVVSDPMSPMNTVDLRRGEGLLGLVVLTLVLSLLLALLVVVEVLLVF